MEMQMEQPNNDQKSAPAGIDFVEEVQTSELNFKVGDFVALSDVDDADVFYARVDSLLRCVVDSEQRFFAAVMWLVPTANAPLDNSFVPNAFVEGFKDSTLYPVEALSLEFRSSPLLEGS